MKYLLPALLTLLCTITPVVAQTPTLATILVTPAVLTIPVGGTAQLTVTDRYSDGTVQIGSTSGLTSSNTAVATVSATGLVTGVKAGTAIIKMTVNTITGDSTVTVE